MNTDDDVMWLREVLTGHDPAIPGRAVLASRPPQHNRRRPARWAVAALAAAAVVAAVVIPVTLSQGARTATPAATNSSSSGAAQPAPAPRPGYDHLRRQDYDGTTPTTTTEWWWNGVSGRELKTDNAGKVLSDVDLALPPDPASAVTDGDPTGPAATRAPTSGVEHMADDFPGTVPTTEQQLRSYMQIKASDPADQVAQRASSLVLQRALTPNQMKGLASILTALPGSNPVTNTVAPDGRQVQVLHPPANNMGGSNETVLNQSGTAVLGMTWTANGHTYWQLLTLSEISTTTR